MPQVTKGGKYIFGWSIICESGVIKLPKMAVEEYKISCEEKVILVSGSKKSGGFCVSRVGLIKESALKDILLLNPNLEEYKLDEGEFIKYKGRYYCWVKISEDGIIHLSTKMMNLLEIKCEDKLLSIRGSNIAFVMAAKGPLIERADAYTGDIEIFK